MSQRRSAKLLVEEVSHGEAPMTEIEVRWIQSESAEVGGGVLAFYRRRRRIWSLGSALKRPANRSVLTVRHGGGLRSMI